MRRPTPHSLMLILTLALAAACSQEEPAPAAAPQPKSEQPAETAAAEPTQEEYPQRAFFGDTHVNRSIYDVAWSGDRQPGDDGTLPAVGSTVNLDDATYSNSIGAPELRAVSTDPDFDPSQKAVYYVRVLEIPTPRWTLYDKVQNGAKLDDNVPLIHQERAFSSPIGYTP